MNGWSVVPSTRLAVASMDPCTITIATIDVAPHLTAQLRSLIDSVVLPPIAATIDRQIASVDFRAALQGAWARLHAPLHLGAIWLALHPEGVVLDALNGSGTTSISPIAATISGDLGVTGRPTVTWSEPTTTTTDLPDPSPSTGGGGFVNASVEISFSEIDAALAVLTASPITVGDDILKLQKLAAKPAGSGQLAIDVAFSSDSFRGTVTLAGVPTVDARQQLVSFPTLDFAVTTDNVLVDAYVWLEKGDLRNKLRQALQFPLDARIREFQQLLIDAAAERDIALTIDHAAVLGFEVTNTLRVDVVLSGAVKVPPIVVP
jgi:hypothetical protein